MNGTILSWVMSDAWPYLIGLLGAAATVFGLRRNAVKGERQKQRIKSLEAAMKAERERDEADADAASGNAHQRLRDDWSR